VSDGDRDLRLRFDHLRAEDRRQLVPFALVWARSAACRERAGSRWRRPSLVVAAALALTVLVLSFPGGPRRTPVAEPPLGARQALETWRAPTDFLLETPGRELLAEVPRLGGLLFEPSPEPERSTSP
jgi:hypothetical protein